VSRENVGFACPVGAKLVCHDMKMRKDNAVSNISNGKVLQRKVDNRIIAGVCAGLADYLDVDVNLVRIVVAVVALITAGTGIVAYLVAWAIIPEEGQKSSIAEDLINKNKFN